MARGRRFIVEVLGDGKSLTKSLKKASDDAMTFGDKVAASTKRMAVPAAAAFAGLSAAAVSFARAAAEDQRAQALLAEQMRATTGATNLQIAATEQFISRLAMASGVADDELRPALAQLVRATGDVGDAQSLLRTALDVSAGSGRSLSSVVQALSRASQGQFTALRRLGIPLDENIIKTKDFDAVLKVLSATFGGQADVAANTAEGRMRRFGVAVDEAKESIGAALLPALEAILPKLIGLAQWVEKNSGLIVGIGTAIAGFSGAILIANAGMKAYAFAAKLMTLANMGLASSNLAVQISTGVGIVSAGIAIGAIAAMSLKMREAANDATNLADALDTATEATRFGFEPAMVDAKNAVNALAGPMGATSEAIFSLGNSLRGGLMGPMGGTFTAIAEKVKDTNKDIGRSTGEAANKFSQFRQQVKATKDAVREYVRSIRDAVTSNVSLSNAFTAAEQEQADATQALTDALEARRSAYEALNQAKQTGDTLGYAKALQDVADAENAVATAQTAKPRDYTSIFRDQIEAAKRFATNLKALLATGNLSRAALQQLLDLGPVAGAQVAQDLLNGVGGFSAASLSADLASISRVGTSVGMAVPGVSELLGSRVGGNAQNYYITVQAGVGDRTAIAREIVDLLKVYNRSNGAIPVRVSG